MKTTRFLLSATSALAAFLLIPGAARAYCPCYTLSSVSNNNNCGVEAANGTNPTTAQWNAIFDIVSQGPAFWGDKGPSVGDIGQGCGKPEAYHLVPASFPCELLKGIAKVETGWRQFCVPDLPSDQVGGPSRTIISFDCGYGVGQVTSGMHTGENPTFDRARVASDATYNLATGTRILAGKWKATNCVGDNQPKIIENWYTATWAYNGLAYVNNPNNPNYDANRGVWKPGVSGGAPYQEKVFGYMEYTNGQWDATALAYPNRGDIAQATNPPDLPEPSCASPTDCVNKRMSHVTSCNGSTSTSASSSTAASSSSSVASSSASVGTGGGGMGGMGGAGGSGGSGGFGSASASTGDSGGSTASSGEEGGSRPDPDENGAVVGFVSCTCEAGLSAGGTRGFLNIGVFASLLGLGVLRRRPRRNR